MSNQILALVDGVVLEGSVSACGYFLILPKRFYVEGISVEMDVPFNKEAYEWVYAGATSNLPIRVSKEQLRSDYLYLLETSDMGLGDDWEEWLASEEGIEWLDSRVEAFAIDNRILIDTCPSLVLENDDLPF